jgi:chorismate-pyruvate lyase
MVRDYSLMKQPIPDLKTLVGLFYADASELAGFQEVEADEVPEPFRRLLVHQEHMTVTVEAFHGCPVDVQAMQVKETGKHYCRTSLLRRQSDGRVVQFGIVRLDKTTLPQAAQREIEGRGKPLGRVLIEHNVLREVELSRLWKVAPGPELRKFFGWTADSKHLCYGRTALIYCNGEPAVELLEIVTPE